MFAEVEKYHGQGEYTVKAGGAEGYAARRRTSGNLLVAQFVDGIGVMFRADGSGGSAARDIARALSSARASSKAASVHVSKTQQRAQKLVMKTERESKKRVIESEKKARKLVLKATKEASKATTSAKPMKKLPG